VIEPKLEAEVEEIEREFESHTKRAGGHHNSERYKALVVVLTVLTTVVTAIVAGLSADANIRATSYNRDSQVYAILAAGELHHTDLKTAYDTNLFTSSLKDTMEATVLQMTALQQDGNPKAAADSTLRAAEDQARADEARKFSIFYTDPRYAPTRSGGTPNMQTYIADSYKAANDLVAQQNTASDGYDRWNRKGDSYTSIMAILAVAFFLFGLAQALSPRMRLLFAVFGLVALAVAGLWTVVVVLV
jgi:hypothetical protein